MSETQAYTKVEARADAPGPGLNEKTTFLHIRQLFDPGFGEDVGADLVRQAGRLRDARPDQAATAVLIRWKGMEPTATVRVVHHPPDVAAPVALVAGRHTRCDLTGIPGASLRHALLLLWPPAGEEDWPFAEVIDLGTQTGISLPDGRLASRVASCDAMRLGIASADVVVLHAPAGKPFPADPEVLARRLAQGPEESEVTLQGSEKSTRHVDVPGVVSVGLSDPPAVEASCVIVPAQSGHVPDFGSDSLMLTQVIRLAQGHANARINVRQQDLKRGVRLGRYDRCRGASVLGNEPQVSRVHALVLERYGHRWLFDTASTNGTQVIDVESGIRLGPIRGERTFSLLEGQAAALAGQIALLDVGSPELPS